MFSKPEYFFNPRQFTRRLAALGRAESQARPVRTAWGAEFVVNESETIGRSLSHFGVYDLALTECLWRLVGAGDTCLDIGANIGYFSSLLAHRVGPQGRVMSFEPHPALFAKLQGHLKKDFNCELHNVALSDKKGVLDLFIPRDFSGNEGTATLQPQSSQSPSGSRIPVQVEVLDEKFEGLRVQVIKIDVEGHELSVFQGAKNILRNTEHVLFEDFANVRSPAIEYLRKLGFEVFRIQKNFLGPALVTVEESARIPLWEPPNFIATRDISSVRAKLMPRGWRCLL
jgi:FkbM family methyltransferase